MMKKTLTAAIAMGLLAASQVHAGTAIATQTSTISGGWDGQCNALGNNITVQLSDGVVASYFCAMVYLQAATCHTTGTFKTQTISCTYNPEYDAEGVQTGNWIPSSALCPGYDPAATTAQTATFEGRLGFRGDSYGGSVGEVELPQLSCNSTTVTELTY